MTVALANCNGGVVTAAFAESLVWTFSEHPRWGYYHVTSPYVAENRNVLARRFLDDDEYDALLFVDSDVQWEPSDVERLLSHGVAVVGGLYFHPLGSLGATANPVAWSSDGSPVEWGDGGLIEVAYVGTGFLMLSRAVLMHLDAAFDRRPFETGYDDAGSFVSEDLMLCRRLAALGYSIHLDADAVVPHTKPLPLAPRAAVELVEEVTCVG